jgi:hypothetical protein
MSAMTPGMDTALAGDRALVTLLIEPVLPAHTMRLLVGSGTVAWGAKTFTSEDSIFGTLGGIDAIEDGDGDQAPSIGFTMIPPNSTAAATLCDPNYQTSPVNFWLAGIDPTTGLLVPDPYLLFGGQIDQPTLNVDKGTLSVDFECVSAFELLLEEDEGARLSDAFHASNWPGETGFTNVTGIQKTLFWGMASPNASGSIVIGNIGNVLGRVVGRRLAD